MIKKLRGLCLLVMGALLLILTGYAAQSEARVSVNIGVNLPDYRFAAPPEVVVIPGTYVYMVPDIDVDVLFFQGYWWRPYEGHWYRSRNYKGSWSYVTPGRIPRGLRELPQDYRQRLSSGHERVHHREVQRNWKKWEKNRHWDRRGEQNRGHDILDRGGRDEPKGRH
ncbi:MAG: hypothetical protein C0402_15700 [Thermodesulfovibrio sp.]|nr:hypothetical protein [Thermodesulfovibrio sp.]